MAKSQFIPVRNLVDAAPTPSPNPNDRSFAFTAQDVFVGPDGREQRSAGPVIPVHAAPKSVARAGVSVGRRQNWKP